MGVCGRGSCTRGYHPARSPAGEVLWLHRSLPSSEGGFDSRRPLSDVFENLRGVTDRPRARRLSSADHGEWRSLVAHPAGGRAVAGSNPVSPTNEKPANQLHRPWHQTRSSPRWTFIGRLTLVVRAEIGGVISPSWLSLDGRWVVGHDPIDRRLGAERPRHLEFEERLEQLASDVARNGVDHPLAIWRGIQLAFLRRGWLGATAQRGWARHGSRCRAARFEIS